MRGVCYPPGMAARTPEPIQALAREDEPVRVPPELEDELVQMIAESEEDERAGRGMTWAAFLEGRAARRGGHDGGP